MASGSTGKADVSYEALPSAVVPDDRTWTGIQKKLSREVPAKVLNEIGRHVEGVGVIYLIALKRLWKVDDSLDGGDDTMGPLNTRCRIILRNPKGP